MASFGASENMALAGVLLAAAAGSLAGTPMQRVLLERTKAIDGSPALYYGEQNTSSTKWVIWIEGGGICQSLSDCQGRANSDLGSSKSFPQTFEIGQGMMQSDCSVNPGFCEWNRVYIPYVSGDIWTGQAASPLNPFPPSAQDSPEDAAWTGYFQGHSIIEEVGQSLRQSYGMMSATEVIFTGCSAGGIGTILNCDFVADALGGNRPGGPRVVCRPEAGWFGLPINDYAHFIAKTVMPDLRHLVSSNWTANISPWSEVSPEGKACQADVLSGKRQIANCAGQKGGAAACCSMLPIYYQYVKTPIYVSENTADKYQVEVQGGMPDNVPLQGYVTYLRNILAGSLSATGGLPHLMSAFTPHSTPLNCASTPVSAVPHPAHVCASVCPLWGVSDCHWCVWLKY
jgi:hypothetical protein